MRIRALNMRATLAVLFALTIAGGAIMENFHESDKGIIARSLEAQNNRSRAWRPVHLR